MTFKAAAYTAAILLATTAAPVSAQVVQGQDCVAASTTPPAASAPAPIYTDPTIKYGVGASTDVELNIAPYETVRTRADGVVEQLGGVGDLYVRLKPTLTNSTSKTQIALVPYVKAPTAKDGIVAPIVFSLPKGVTLNFGPEVDILADADGHGHHAQLVSLVNLSKSFGKATVYGEFWKTQNSIHRGRSTNIRRMSRSPICWRRRSSSMSAAVSA